MGAYLSASDVEFETMRSGGPGGQHGDRRATAVRLRVAISDLDLSEREQDWVREHLPPRNKTKDGELLVRQGGSRSQKRNRKDALEVANEEIEKAIEKGRREQEEEQHKKRIRRRKRRSGSDGDGSSTNRQEERQKRFRSESTGDLLERARRADPERMKELLGEEEEPKEADGEDSEEDEETASS